MGRQMCLTDGNDQRWPIDRSMADSSTGMTAVFMVKNKVPKTIIYLHFMFAARSLLQLINKKDKFSL